MVLFLFVCPPSFVSPQILVCSPWCLPFHVSAAIAAASPDAVLSAVYGERVRSPLRKILADQRHEFSRFAQSGRNPFAVGEFQLPKSVGSEGEPPSPVRENC
jgi:hypothetical protein